MSEERHFRIWDGNPPRPTLYGLAEYVVPIEVDPARHIYAIHNHTVGLCPSDCPARVRHEEPRASQAELEATWEVDGNPTTYSNEPSIGQQLDILAEQFRMMRDAISCYWSQYHQDEQPRDEFTRDPWTEVGEPYGDDMPGMTLDEFQAWSDQIIRETQGDE